MPWANNLMYCNYMQLWVGLWGTGAVSSWEKLTNIWKPTRVGNFQARVWFLNCETIRKGENRVVQVLLCVGIPLSGQHLKANVFSPIQQMWAKIWLPGNLLSGFVRVTTHSPWTLLAKAQLFPIKRLVRNHRPMRVVGTWREGCQVSRLNSHVMGHYCFLCWTHTHVG